MSALRDVVDALNIEQAGQRARRQRGKDLIDILENKSAFLQPSNATAGVYINGPGYTVFEHEICFLSWVTGTLAVKCC